MELGGGCGEQGGVTRRDTQDLTASLDVPERFGSLFDRHYASIWSYLARVGGQQAADDLAGEVFTRAFAGRHRFDPERGEVRPWLYGIATNLWRARCRSSARGRAALARLESRDLLVLDDEEALAGAIDADRRCRDVMTALGALGEADRSVVVLFAWESLSYAEIAAVLDVPVGTVRSRLARARARLRELLDPDGQLPRADRAEPRSDHG